MHALIAHGTDGYEASDRTHLATVNVQEIRLSAAPLAVAGAALCMRRNPSWPDGSALS